MARRISGPNRGGTPDGWIIRISSQFCGAWLSSGPKSSAAQPAGAAWMPCWPASTPTGVNSTGGGVAIAEPSPHDTDAPSIQPIERSEPINLPALRRPSLAPARRRRPKARASLASGAPRGRAASSIGLLTWRKGFGHLFCSVTLSWERRRETCEADVPRRASEGGSESQAEAWRCLAERTTEERRLGTGASRATD